MRGRALISLGECVLFDSRLRIFGCCGGGGSTGCFRRRVFRFPGVSVARGFGARTGVESLWTILRRPVPSFRVQGLDCSLCPHVPLGSASSGSASPKQIISNAGLFLRGITIVRRPSGLLRAQGIRRTRSAKFRSSARHLRQAAGPGRVYLGTRPLARTSDCETGSCRSLFRRSSHEFLRHNQ